MKNYDNEQLQAIKAKNGHFLVLAPPGCGKTDILAERVIRAIQDGTQSEDMLCLTFTNRASRGMKNRVTEMNHNKDCQVFVGNIHRFCSNFLIQNALLPEQTGIIDDEDLAEIFLAMDPVFFRNKMGDTDRMKTTTVDNIEAYLSQRMMQHPQEAIFLPPHYEQFYRIAAQAHFDAALVPPEHQLVKFALLYKNYKQERTLISFSDILIKAYDALLHDHEHKFKRYSWIQVDEVQDLNALQTALIEVLTDTTRPFTVMYLGDEQQAIFSFIGAKLEQLEKLRQKCAGNIMTLGKNYRSPQYLLDVFNTYATRCLGVNRALLPQATRHEPHHKLDLILTENTSSETEENRISGMIRYYLGLGEKERLAFLVPTNADADRISTRLEKDGIPHFKISGTDMFKSASFKLIAAFCNICVNPFHILAWTRLLQSIGAVNSSTKTRELMNQLQQLMMTPIDLIDESSYVARFNEAYQNSTFVFFDTETTGLNVLTDDIVQIAAFKVNCGKRIPDSDFNIFLHTQQEIPAKLGQLDNPLLEAYATHPHLSPQEGLERFLNYIGDCPVLGHNVEYDYQILQHNVKRHLHKSITLEVYDSLHLAKCVEPGRRMYKLAFLLQELQLKGKNSHLADEDVEATLALVDYCHRKSKDIATKQVAFKALPHVQHVCTKMQSLHPLLKHIQKQLTEPCANEPKLANTLQHIYHYLLDQHIITPLGYKWDIFLRFVAHEWEEQQLPETLACRIIAHTADLAAGLSEGDLMNSDDLIKERVFIMTVHKGKGLEFENVVILKANDGTYPFYTTNNILANPERYMPQQLIQAQQDYMEDARKFYVALSRAKKRLCVSFSHTNSRGRHTHITPFMAYIQKYFYTGQSQ